MVETQRKNIYKEYDKGYVQINKIEFFFKNVFVKILSTESDYINACDVMEDTSERQKIYSFSCAGFYEKSDRDFSELVDKIFDMELFVDEEKKATLIGCRLSDDFYLDVNSFPIEGEALDLSEIE